MRAKAVVMATGGGGRLHYQGYPTTNHYGATADGLVMAYRAGAKLIYMDTMQYHPTGVAYPPQILGQLVTEKVRTLGAQLVNKDGERFIHHLETRDVVASAIIRECRDGKGLVTPTGQPCVWLDSPMIDILRGKGTVQKEVPAMYRQFARFGIYMDKEPILVYPTLHYQNGGILINPDAATNIPGFVCGWRSRRRRARQEPVDRQFHSGYFRFRTPGRQVGCTVGEAGQTWGILTWTMLAAGKIS